MSSKGDMGAFEKTQRESKKQRQRLHSDKEKGQKKRDKGSRTDSNGTFKEANELPCLNALYTAL